jgi:hypothetical protein
MRVNFCLDVFSRKGHVCAVSESRKNSVPINVRILRLRASFDMGGDRLLKFFAAGIVNIF